MFLYQKLKYTYKYIDTSDVKKATSELADFIIKAHQEKPNYIAYDTETTGLNIITDKPFLVSMGFNKTVIVMDYNKEVMNNFWKMYQLPMKDDKTPLQNYKNYVGLFAHNAKYDYHMMQNGGSPIPEDIRIYDSITIARLTEYADEKTSMSLEALGTKYVDESAKFGGKIIKDIIKKLRAERKAQLKIDLMKAYPDEKFGTITKNGVFRGTAKLKELLDGYDKQVKFVDDDNEFYKFIDEHYKEPNYEDAYKHDPELVRSYAADDVVIELEYMNKSFPALKNIDTDFKVLKREGELIRAVAFMENTGIAVDVDYVLKCRKNMLNYRDLLYMELNLYTGLDFSVGQHEYIKKMLLAKYKIKTEKADEKALKYIEENCDNDEVKAICKNIMELRTLDKWLSTYVDGKLNSLIYNEPTKTYRIYTDINNSGAVSGRVSCDMQQQPKEALFDRDGNELFHPRRMFVCDDGYCFAFCDESQMELRLQAYYTMIHASEPDKSMCRAYMPYKCYKKENDTKIEFDPYNVTMLKTFNDYKWYLNENDEEWTPTDLHSETTRHAFPNIPMGTPEFKKHRKLGKRANFLKVYQGGVDALMNSLDINRETAEALDKAFYTAFPRIKDYQDWVVEHLTEYGYVENLYGRRYYMNNSKWYYRACNYLIQGTCADMVKLFEIRVWKYLTENHLKSRMMLPIHDELMVSVAKDELFVIKEVKRIMEDVTDVVKSIPMVSESEISYTNWAEKEDYIV